MSISDSGPGSARVDALKRRFDNLLTQFMDRLDWPEVEDETQNIIENLVGVLREFATARDEITHVGRFAGAWFFVETMENYEDDWETQKSLLLAFSSGILHSEALQTEPQNSEQESWQEKLQQAREKSRLRKLRRMRDAWQRHFIVLKSPGKADAATKKELELNCSLRQMQRNRANWLEAAAEIDKLPPDASE